MLNNVRFNEIMSNNDIYNAVITAKNYWNGVETLKTVEDVLADLDQYVGENTEAWRLAMLHTAFGQYNIGRITTKGGVVFDDVQLCNTAGLIDWVGDKGILDPVEILVYNDQGKEVFNDTIF